MAKGGMRGRAGKVARDTDEELKEEEIILLRATAYDLARLKPQISDPAALEKLIEAVEQSTRCNDNVAMFQARIKALGKGVERIAKEAYSLLKPPV
jgi:hypothetical protein